ncbi:uncharacterized protein LOC124941010 [Impatiens glandulifera]|uniref:uncharacterized protein LOC124941010 n=1 Tax=Impatiens glandulifera TaxID=253017 RepID=UPI001FB1274A|nr:uncharacterized protein LOC124941010 [Impatiens glandulifera]
MERLLTVQSRQKSYIDKKRSDLTFKNGGHVFLKVSPYKGIIIFGKKEKLYPRKYIPNFNHIIQCEDVQLAKDLSYEELLNQILVRQTRKLRNKEMNMVKMFWHNNFIEEITWEVE